ncbi:hypothetical protein IX51_06905 [uncultured archaeon]|nr:hypothetical protein IX51_06905 [uncultured archaeon]
MSDITGSLLHRGSSITPVEIEPGKIKLSDLEQRNIIIGRPGTGKTTTLKEIIGEFLNRGNSPSELLYLTYSRAMASDAREKIGLKRHQAGTIHSIFSIKLGWRHSKNPNKSAFLSDKDMSDFAEEYGIRKKFKARPREEHGNTHQGAQRPRKKMDRLL